MSLVGVASPSHDQTEEPTLQSERADDRELEEVNDERLASEFLASNRREHIPDDVNTSGMASAADSARTSRSEVLASGEASAAEPSPSARTALVATVVATAAET